MDSPGPEQSSHYLIVEQAIRYIRDHAPQQPSLAEVAASACLSEYHLQRVFTQWAGLSPKRFLQFLTKQHAQQALRNSRDVLTASLDSGLSSPGRLHDLMVSCDAMSPGEIKTGGKGVTVVYGFGVTPFGNAFIAWTERGICNLAFCNHGSGDVMQALQQEWPAATLEQNDAAAARMTDWIFSSRTNSDSFRLLLRGTNFQIKAWEALLNIGSAQLASYRTLAAMTGSPGAHRSVGSAMAANRIAYLIPCHRVIRESGDAGTYHWGSERKLAMHAWEAAREKPPLKTRTGLASRKRQAP